MKAPRSAGRFVRSGSFVSDYPNSVFVLPSKSPFRRLITLL